LPRVSKFSRKAKGDTAWRKLRREIEALERRQNPLLAAAERARWRSINREFRRFTRENDR